MFCLIKEINWLISKGIYVLLFDVSKRCSLPKKLIGKEISKIYNSEKLTFSKHVGKVNLSERKFEEMD